MRIQELELEFGVSLFDRSKRKARVTKKGQQLIPFAEKLLGISATMRQTICAPDAMVGSIRIGVAEVISLTWLPQLMQTLHNLYPKIIFELDEALTEDLVNNFENGTLDLILIPGRIVGENLSVSSLGSVDFQWMASPKLCVIEKFVTPLELQKWPIIALSEQSFHFSRIKNWFTAGHGKYRQDYRCKSVGVAYSLTKYGLGVALLPVKHCDEDLKLGRLRIIKTVPPMPSVEFFVISRKKGINILSQSIADIAKEISDFKKI